MRYTAVGSEVDYEKIKEILERYFGARWKVEWNFSFLQRPKFKVCLLEFFKVDADRDKAVIFNVDICDYYFEI